MAAAWNDAPDQPIAGPSFIDRARNAPEDDDVPMGDAFRRSRSAGLLLPQDAAEETPFQQLIRHWLNERHAPDILPGQELLLGRLLDHIRKQVSRAILPITLPAGLRARGTADHEPQLMRFSSSPAMSTCCAATPTPRKRSTSGSCSCRPRSNESNSSSAPTSARDCTR